MLQILQPVAGERESRAPNPESRSRIPNPQSPIPNPYFTSSVSLSGSFGNGACGSAWYQ